MRWVIVLFCFSIYLFPCLFEIREHFLISSCVWIELRLSSQTPLHSKLAHLLETEF